MKFIVAEQELDIPEGVTVDVKARKISVKGKLGTLTRTFKHVPIDIRKETSSKAKTFSTDFNNNLL
jgi:large subunit ribosomal protein L9e